MQRKMDLILMILAWLAEQPGTWATLPKTFPGYTEDVVYYHIELCMQAGFIHKGVEVSTYTRLTWQGHEKLEELQTTVKGFAPA